MAASNLLRSFRRFASSGSGLQKSDLPPDAVILQITKDVPNVLYARPKLIDPDESPFNYNPTKDCMIGLGISLAAGFAWKVCWDITTPLGVQQSEMKLTADCTILNFTIFSSICTSLYQF